MFDGNQDFYGVQANYLKDLCELRGNVPDKAQHNNFKIFASYVDAYTVCPRLGISIEGELLWALLPMEMWVSCMSRYPRERQSFALSIR